MGLVGRLEDLPITDILQIVFLSRGTGILRLQLAEGLHSVVFLKGLVVNAASPDAPSLRSDLEKRLGLGSLDVLAHEKEIPVGLAALEMNLIAPDDVAAIVSERVTGIIRKLSGVADGEFEFVAREPSVAEMEYEPAVVFRRGGIPPETILGKEAVRLRTLGNIKESLNKVVSQRTTLPGPQPPAPAFEHSLLYVGSDRAVQEELRRASTQKRFAFEELSVDEAPKRTNELLNDNRSFAAILDLDVAETLSKTFLLVREIKSRDSRVPVIITDSVIESERRHLSLEAGADHYLVKPPAEQPLFAADLLLVASRRFAELQNEQSPPLVPTTGEPMVRGFRLLVQLIKEASDPSDVSPVTLTILQLAADYVDRCVLFAIKGDQFVTLGKFGIRDHGSGLRLRRGELPVIDGVVSTGQVFRGKVDSSLAEQLASSFAGRGADELVIIPMLSGKHVTGILYGDNALQHQPIGDTLGLEIFLAQAGFAFHSFLFGSAASGELAAGKPLLA